MSQVGTSSYVVRSFQNERDQNEDSYHIMLITPVVGGPPIHLLAVADGMGGHAYGEVVSKEALRKFSLSLVDGLCVEPGINQVPNEDPVEVEALKKKLYESFEYANSHIHRIVEANHWGKSGTTLVAALVFDDKVIVGNLGDSPLFHFQVRDNELVKRTQDHTVAGVLLRGGMITEEMARYHEGKDRLEFFIGAENLPKDPPVWDFVVEEGDLLLLCSDGVNGEITESQIAAILSDIDLDLDQKADALIQAALDAGEGDNQTLILWSIDSLESVAEPSEQPPGFESITNEVEM